MSDFLLELRSEEIPARMQVQAKADLARLFAAELAKHGLKAAAIETFATPRRLALIARDLPDATEAASEELKGPRTAAPAQALDGFLRKTGLTRDQLTERDGIWFATRDKPGRPTIQVLAEAIPIIVRAFPWPKSMRWGAASLSTESLRWVRPLQGIVALLGETIVPFDIDDVHSGAATLGHRFVHPGPITIGSAHDYIEKLRACHVIMHFSERCAIIRDGARAAAAAAGLTLVEDEGLVAENAGLTEWPVPLLGRFDESYLSVPQEIIQLTARVNQKYFVCTDSAGKLANAFVCTANIDAPDGGVGIVDGNRKVIASRLADAKFFWDNDLQVKLDQQAEKLSQIVFHEKLGTVADKVERVAKLARWLVTENIVTPAEAGVHLPNLPQADIAEMDSRLRGNDEEMARLADQAERAARLDEEGIVGGGIAAPTSGKSVEEKGGLRQAQPSRRLDQAALADLAERAAHGIVGGGTATPTADLPELVEGLPSSPFRQSEESKGGLRQAQPSRPLDQAALATLAERAARLCKADLVTGTVGEFPELQGVIGGHLARAQGEDDAVADAIRDHYKPVGQGDDVPTAPVTVAVSLADKLDTLAAFFVIDEKPTGSKDPFALRRAAISCLSIIFANQLRGPIITWLAEARRAVTDQGVVELRKQNYDGATVHSAVKSAWDLVFMQEVRDFFADRLKVQQREAGVRHDLIDAVFALGNEDDLVRLLARVRALQAFVETPEGTNLLAGYKRAANILKKEGFGAQESASKIGNDLALLPEEQALVAALDSAEPQATAAIEAEDFAAAMRALAALREPIDAFFDKVTVNDPDPDTRLRRLATLARFRDAVHRVADFSKIEG